MHPEPTPPADSRTLAVGTAHPLSPVDELMLLTLAPVVAFLVAVAIATLVLALVRPGFVYGTDDASWQAACATVVHAADARSAKA